LVLASYDGAHCLFYLSHHCCMLEPVRTGYRFVISSCCFVAWSCALAFDSICLWPEYRPVGQACVAGDSRYFGASLSANSLTNRIFNPLNVPLPAKETPRGIPSRCFFLFFGFKYKLIRIAEPVGDVGSSWGLDAAQALRGHCPLTSIGSRLCQLCIQRELPRPT